MLSKRGRRPVAEEMEELLGGGFFICVNFRIKPFDAKIVIYKLDQKQKIMKKNWHNLEPNDVLRQMATDRKGLASGEILKRLQKYGPNKLPEAKVDSLFMVFFRQYQSPLIYVLIAAAFILLAMRHFTDAAVVFCVLFFNAIIGTIQEGRAMNLFIALKNLVETKAVVLREGREMIISDTEIVPGDIIILDEGDKVPADARIINCQNLKINESSFTGESVPIEKDPEIISKDKIPISEMKNMVFKGTNVVEGRCEAVVIATGVETEIGKITKEISEIDTDIPLKKDIEKLSKSIIVVVGIISITLFTLGILQNRSLEDMFSLAVAISISIIPEGLPIVMTLVLATGVWRMSKKNALIKKLQAVEALGQADVIAVDKTGTITKNKMSVTKVFVNGRYFEVEDSGYNPKGNLMLGGETISPDDYPEILELGKMGNLGSKARLFYVEEEKSWKISGDPTEGAILVFSGKLGLDKEVLEQQFTKLEEVPFDHKKKFRATVNVFRSEMKAIVLGAPEEVMRRSHFYRENSKNRKINNEKKDELEKAYKKMSREGLRTVAVAFKDLEEQNEENRFRGLTLVGFVGIRDMLREESFRSIAEVRGAGIHVVMITGDHRLTAEFIAKEAGILKPGERILTGEEMDQLSPGDLARIIGDVKVFARVTPEHKLKIINAFREKGKIVAMTGDGVNDAPSLVAADLGVAMGKSGTEVAKEAADIVLLDDNFESIASAIEEGRNIFKTIKRVILYLFSTGLGEVLTIVFAMLLNWPLPILPVQIIWLNVVTDSFLDVSLAMEPKSKELLKKSFRKKSRSLLDATMIKRMLVMSVPMAIGTLIMFSTLYETDIRKAWTVSLTTLAVFQWLNAWNCRHTKKSIFTTNPFSNKFLNLAFLVVIALQILVVYAPFMQKIFHTTALNIYEWLVIIAVSFSIVIFEEIRKFLARRFDAANA